MKGQETKKYFIMKLNQKQQKVVSLNSHKHIVLAPPGTGKTEILVQRILKAIENGINTENMISLTFTNRAAKSMESRVKSKINVESLFIGNIHSFCLNLLKESGVFRFGNVLLDEDEQKNILRDIIENYINLDQITGYLVLEMSVYPNTAEKKAGYIINDYIPRLVKYYKYSYRYKINSDLNKPIHTDDSIIQKYLSEFNEVILNITQDYIAELKRLNAYDFDDLIALAYLYLLKFPETNNKYSWVQVDEAQDLNPIQWEIIELLTSEKSHHVYFGDYEQSIYSFLDADLKILDSVVEECTIHNLNINYRSPKYLLDLYNKYALENLNPKWTESPTTTNLIDKSSTSLELYEITGNQIDEINTIVELYNKKLNKDGETTAILVRTNKQADDFSKLIDTEHFKISGNDLMKSKFIKLFLAVLSVIQNPYDRVSWSRVLENYGSKSLKFYRKFVSEFYNKGILMSDYLSDDYQVLESFKFELNHSRIIIFDTETTGLDVYNDDIIQIACIELINGKIGKTFEVYIDTEKDLTQSEKIHNISKQTLIEKGINRQQAFINFINFVGDDTLVAHNLKYDFDIIKYNFLRYGVEVKMKNKWVDSIDLAKRIYPNLPKYKLEYLLEYLKVEGVNSHNALDDVKATANVVINLFSNIDDLLNQRTEIFEKYNKSLKKFIVAFKPDYDYYTNLLDKESSFLELFLYFKNKFGTIFHPEGLYKLERFFTKNNTYEITSDLLSNYLEVYKRYNESDLVIGDEKLLISTIHKSKGLEFDNVIIPFCHDKDYPMKFNRSQSQINESARLLYVGITRAKKTLIISYHTKPDFSYDKNEDMFLSRFIRPLKSEFTFYNIHT